MSIFEKNDRKWNQVAYFLINNNQYTLAQLLTTKAVYKKFVKWTKKNLMPDDFYLFGKHTSQDFLGGKGDARIIRFN